MALSIEELRAKEKARAAQSSAQITSSIFQFSSLKAGEKYRIRFIDDGDKETPNDVFWRTHCSRSLKFDSIRLPNGEVVANTTYVSVPAFNRKPGDDKEHENDYSLPESYIYNSKDDVINTRIKPLWDDTPEGQATYKRFGRSVKRIFQGFVRTPGEEPKLYRFLINKDLFKTIYSYIDDDEISVNPCDVENGREFILNVTEKTANINGHSAVVKDYSSSKWSSNVSPLTDEEKAYLAEHSSYALKEFIPSRPSIEQEKVMLEMFDAAYQGEPYDVAKWSKIFKPNNVSFDEAGNIKDVKSNGSMNAPRSIPQAPVVAPREVKIEAEPVVQTMEMYTVAPVQPAQPVVQEAPAVQQTVTAFANAMDPQQLAQMLASLQQAQQSTPVAQPTATQLINEHSETVTGQDGNEVIGNLMSRFGN